jgi:hypothetical protein
MLWCCCLSLSELALTWPELAVMGRIGAPKVTLGLEGDGLLVVRAADYLPAGTQVRF